MCWIRLLSSPSPSRLVRTVDSFSAHGEFDDRSGEKVGQRVLEAVVAVDAGDFFDEVDLAFEVEAPAWQRDLIIGCACAGAGNGA